MKALLICSALAFLIMPNLISLLLVVAVFVIWRTTSAPARKIAYRGQHRAN